jgi:SnoaL-like domain
MSATIRDLVIEYNQAFGDGRLERVAQMLHPDVAFDGTVGKPTRGAAEYMTGLPRLAKVVVRNDIREIVVEGNRAFVLYDFVTDTPAGAVLSGEFLTFEDGLIRSITLIYDWRRWPELVAEVVKRNAPVGAASNS